MPHRLKYLLGDFSGNAVIEDAADQAAQVGGRHRAAVDAFVISIELAQQLHLHPVGGEFGIAAVRSNCAWSLGRLCRELPSNVVYATAVDALIQVLEEDLDIGVREDAKSALLKLGDPRGIQAIETLEAEGYNDISNLP